MQSPLKSSQSSCCSSSTLLLAPSASTPQEPTGPLARPASRRRLSALWMPRRRLRWRSLCQTGGRTGCPASQPGRACPQNPPPVNPEKTPPTNWAPWKKRKVTNALIPLSGRTPYLFGTPYLVFFISGVFRTIDGQRFHCQLDSRWANVVLVWRQTLACWYVSSLSLAAMFFRAPISGLCCLTPVDRKMENGYIKKVNPYSKVYF